MVQGSEEQRHEVEGHVGVEPPQSADLWSVLFRTRGEQENDAE